VDEAIERLQRIASLRRGVLALGGGLPAPELFPREALARAFDDALATPRCEALQYGWPEGRSDLRAWIARRLRARGADVHARDVVITAGAQQAIAVACEALLVRGARVGVDAETYPAALELFRTRGATPVVARDVAVRYVMPGIANPRGDALSSDARAVILASSRAIIADEAYAELRFDGARERPLLADAPERVWHVGTFSKSLCPGFRVGWLVPPRAELARVRRIKHDIDLQANSLGQAVLAALLRRFDVDAHLARAAALYRARAERFARALRASLPSFRFRDPEGGFSIFVETDAGGDDARFLEIATAHGIGFDPGRIFRASQRSSPIALRLCFSAVRDDLLDVAVERLARAWRAFAARRTHGDVGVRNAAGASSRRRHD